MPPRAGAVSARASTGSRIENVLPRPGSDPQLRELGARLLERPLNRAKPLWEIWMIEGLAGGRFAG